MGKVNEICRKHRIKQGITLADWPQLNGVAERSLTLIDSYSSESLRFPGEDILQRRTVPRYCSSLAQSTQLRV